MRERCSSFTLVGTDVNPGSAGKSALWGGPGGSGEKMSTVSSNQPDIVYTSLQVSYVPGAS